MLHENRTVLARHGICYPMAGQEGVHAHFAIYHDLLRRDSTASLQRALGECRPHAAGLLSCEAFWLLPEEQIARLAAALHGIETEAILYLRAPAAYLPSSYRQAIRHNGIHQGFADYIPIARQRLDYPRLLSAWARHFPLQVRVYEKEKTALCLNFCTLAGLPAAELVFPADAVNRTPSDGALRLMRCANAILPARLSRRVRRALLTTDRLFAFLPALDDSAAAAAAREIVGAWNPAVLRNFLPEAEIDLLRATGAKEMPHV